MNIEDLKKHGALLEGHFELSSGLHSDKYVQCEKLNETWKTRNEINNSLIRAIDNDKIDWSSIDVIIGGAYGAIRFVDRIGDAIFNKYKKHGIRCIFCERVPEIEYGYFHVCPDDENCYSIKKDKILELIDSGRFKLRRGFEIKKGDKVLIAEDVTTTGKSIGEVAELVKEHGGEIVGAINIIDRRLRKSDELQSYECKGKQVEIIKPFISLIQLDMPTWRPDECPLCKKSCDNCGMDMNKCVPDTDKPGDYAMNISDCKKWQPKYPLVKPGSKK